MCSRPTEFQRVENPEGPGSVLTFVPVIGSGGGHVMPRSRRWLRVPIGYEFEGGQPPEGWFELPLGAGQTVFLDDKAERGSMEALTVNGEPVYCRLLSSTPPEPQGLEVRGKQGEVVEARTEQASTYPF